MKPTPAVRRCALALCGATLVVGAAGCGQRSGATAIEAREPSAPSPGATPAAPPGADPADPAVIAEVEAAMAATAQACSQPAGTSPEGATEARDVVPGKIAVVGSDGKECLLGVADLIVVSDTKPIPDYVPVYDVEDQDRVIGYWADGYGWVTPQQRNDPAFDLAARRAAYAHIMANGPGPQD